MTLKKKRADKEKSNEVGISKLDTIPINSVLGNDLLFTGDIFCEGLIRIDGKVKGNIVSKQGVILGEKGSVEGMIESDYIILFGHIKGNIKSKELILKSTGFVMGDIVTDSIEVEMGSKYIGNLKIGKPGNNQPETTDTNSAK